MGNPIGPFEYDYSQDFGIAVNTTGTTNYRGPAGITMTSANGIVMPNDGWLAGLALNSPATVVGTPGTIHMDVDVLNKPRLITYTYNSPAAAPGNCYEAASFQTAMYRLERLDVFVPQVRFGTFVGTLANLSLTLFFRLKRL